TLAVGQGWAGVPADLKVPARSTQSRLTMTSACLMAATSSSLTKAAGGLTWSGWSVGKAAPTLRLVPTRAPTASASATRAFQASGLRDTRPARVSGFFAPAGRALPLAGPP